MKKSKRILLPVLFVCLLAAGLWLYWEWPMTMDTLIPEESWVRVELRHGAWEGDFQEMTFESPELDRILPQMGAVRLTRAEKRTYLDDRYFQIILHNGETYSTMLYVGSTGHVQIAKELDFDHWKNYEGGEAFYRYLENYSRSLSAIIEVAQ